MNWRNFRFGGSCIIAIIFIGIVPFAYLLLGMSNFHFISSVWDSKVFPGVQVDLGKYALFLQPPGLCSPPPPHGLQSFYHFGDGNRRTNGLKLGHYIFFFTHGNTLGLHH